jgi:hypothetical protein
MVRVFYLPNRSLYAFNEEEGIQQWEEYKMAWQYTHIGKEKVSELM